METPSKPRQCAVVMQRYVAPHDVRRTLISFPVIEAIVNLCCDSDGAYSSKTEFFVSASTVIPGFTELYARNADMVESAQAEHFFIAIVSDLKYWSKNGRPELIALWTTKCPKRQPPPQTFCVDRKRLVQALVEASNIEDGGLRAALDRVVHHEIEERAAYDKRIADIEEELRDTKKSFMGVVEAFSKKRKTLTDRIEKLDSEERLI